MTVEDDFNRLNVIKIVNCGESAYVLYFAGQDLSERNQNVRRFTYALDQQRPEWLTEIVPSFDTVMLCFSPMDIDRYDFFKWLKQIEHFDSGAVTSAHHVINVCYDRYDRFDLASVAKATECSIDDVIAMHAAKTYTAYAVGFAPGFAYLGETNKSIQLPRLASPRTKVPAGAVAIADSYTAVYPSESPGGWHLIGVLAEEECSMFERNVQVGDTIEFRDTRLD